MTLGVCGGDDLRPNSAGRSLVFRYARMQFVNPLALSLTLVYRCRQGYYPSCDGNGPQQTRKERKSKARTGRLTMSFSGTVLIFFFFALIMSSPGAIRHPDSLVRVYCLSLNLDARIMHMSVFGLPWYPRHDSMPPDPAPLRLVVN